jgi:hypothetical protein
MSAEKLKKIQDKVRPGVFVKVMVFDGSEGHTIQGQVENQLPDATVRCMTSGKEMIVKKFRARIDEECYLEFILDRVVDVGNIESFTPPLPATITYESKIGAFWKTFPHSPGANINHRKSQQ